MAGINSLENFKHSLGFFDYVFSSNNKIWILWTSGHHAMLLSSADQFVHMLVSHDAYIPTFRMTFVYAKSTCRELRQLLWDDLHAHEPSIGDHPWLVGVILIRLQLWMNLLDGLHKMFALLRISVLLFLLAASLSFQYQAVCLLGMVSEPMGEYGNA